MPYCCKCGRRVLNHHYCLHHQCFIKWFCLENAVEFSNIAPRSQSQSPLVSQEKNISFFHGAFRKYSAQLEKKNYILKVVQDEHPELPATEYVSNQIYELLGVEIPPYYLIRYPADYCFATLNFMAQYANSSLVHIYHYLREGDDYNCENVIEVIGHLTKRRIEQERFAYLLLADSLIGNHDRHGRNLGFIQSSSGFVLSPFYDNPSYIGLNDDSMLGADLQPKGAIYTKKSKEPTIEDYIIELNRLGFEKVVKQFKQKCLIKKIDSLVQKSILSDKRKKALLRLIYSRVAQL